MQPNSFQPGPVQPSAARPEKFAWVTIPLIIQIVLYALALLVALLWAFGVGILPLSWLTEGSSDPSNNLSPQAAATFKGIFSAFAWLGVLFALVFLLLSIFALRAFNARRNSGRVLAIVLFILALFSIPIGTVLGIFGLIGAFDPEVQRYTSA